MEKLRLAHSLETVWAVWRPVAVEFGAAATLRTRGVSPARRSR